MSNTQKNEAAETANETVAPTEPSVHGAIAAEIAADLDGGNIAPNYGDEVSTDVETTTIVTPYEDSTIAVADLPTILQRVSDGQATAKTQFVALEKQRGKTSKDLSIQLSEAFVTIQKIRHNCSSSTIAQVFASFGVKPAIGNISQFTPWINIFFAEKVEGKTVKNVTGANVQKWAVNPNYSRYFHLFERLEREGMTSGHAKFIDDLGGASTIVKKALDEKRAEEKLTDEQVKERLDLWIDVTSKYQLTTDLPLPKEEKEFVTILCRRVGAELHALEFASEDAASVANRFAIDAFDDLRAEIEKREEREKIREEERAKLIAEPGLLAKAIANRPQD